LARKCRSLDVSQSYEPPGPVTGTALIFLALPHYLDYVAWNARVIDELERIWKKVVQTYEDAIQNFPGGKEKNHVKLRLIGVHGVV
jgi:hypothetical protein